MSGKTPQGQWSVLCEVAGYLQVRGLGLGLAMPPPPPAYTLYPIPYTLCPQP